MHALRICQVRLVAYMSCREISIMEEKDKAERAKGSG